jgi:signal recognition particle subunit SEC65
MAMGVGYRVHNVVILVMVREREAAYPRRWVRRKRRMINCARRGKYRYLMNPIAAGY